MMWRLLQLGAFQFSVGSAAYDRLRRNRSWRWPSQERLGGAPARQFVGPGDETIDLDGRIYPHYVGGIRQLDALVAAAGLGQPMICVTGSGDVLGRYVVLSVEETGTLHFPDGTPRRVDFGINLAAYGEGLP